MPAALPACSDNSLHQNIESVRQYMDAAFRAAPTPSQLAFCKTYILSDQPIEACKSRTQRIRLAKQTWQSVVQRVQMMLDVIACTLEGRPGFSVADECYQPCSRRIVVQVMGQLGATLQGQITVHSDDAQRPKCRWHLSAERQNEVQELLGGGVLIAASPPWYQALLAKYELALRAGKSTLAAASNKRSRATVFQTQSEPNAAAFRPGSSPSSKRTCRAEGIACSERTAPVWQQQTPPSLVPSQQASPSTQQHGAPPSSGGPACKLGRQRPARSHQPHHLRLHRLLHRLRQLCTAFADTV